MTATPDVPVPGRATPGAAAAGQPARPASRAGRNLGSAIAVGLGLGAVILVPLLTVRQTFVGVLAVTMAIATWELRDALRRGAGIEVPLPALLVGGQAMIWLSWPFGLRGLALSFAATALGCLVWRMRAGAVGLPSSGQQRGRGPARIPQYNMQNVADLVLTSTTART